MYTHIANNDGTCDILKDGTKVDTVGPWETQDEAVAWGSDVCDKYNSPEYSEIEYPKEAGAAAEKAALLERLGITEDEAKLLLG